MRSPVIAFGLFAAAAVSPSLVSAAPAGTPNVAGLVPHIPSAPNPASSLPAAPVRRQDVHDVVTPPTINTDGKKHKQRSKRALDSGTAGGNAYSGGSSDASGGNLANYGGDGDDDTVMSTDANETGDGDVSGTGDAEGGRGRGFGPGGNAYTGASSNAAGGNIVNDGGEVTNDDANFAGYGGDSTSGNAEGGNAMKKRAVDANTAGGNAYTGSSGNTGSGNIYNESNDDDSTITNTDSNFGDEDSGESTTGTAEGGNGDGKGPGGNAYSGTAGPTKGGNVVNSGGSINNNDANFAGYGDESLSGDARGGDAASSSSS